MRFSPHILDDIRNRLQISDIVGSKVTWDRKKSQPAKGDYWACCPFHQEKSPSFHCDNRRGRYHCFGCGASGDHFRFLTETEGLNFPEAVERLAESAGVSLPAPDPQAAKREEKRSDLRDVVEAAAKFFESQFYVDRGRDARAYAAGRLLSEAIVREFRIGYAPNSRDALKSHLKGLGISEEEMALAGLVIKPEDGRPAYDRFRNRLIIPIEDDRGRVIAFGGRALDPMTEPKYLNSPETPLFYKSTTLFNAHRVRKDVHESGTAIVVEGYLDAIAVYQSGIKTVVASLGTAFTEDQIARLWRLAPEPVICFDGDKAGVAAAHRSVDRILPELKGGYSFNFVFLPDGKDPDDLIQTGGRDAFLMEVKNALPLADVLWRREIAGARIDTPERQAALEKQINSLVFSIKDETVQRGYRQSMRMRLSELFWSRRGKQKRSTGTSGGKTWAGDNRQGNKEEGGAQQIAASSLLAGDADLVGLERIVLGVSVAYPHLFEENIDRMTSLRFSLASHARFRDELERLITTLDKTDAVGMAADADPRFFAIMREVFGDVELDGAARSSKLFKRVPFLRHQPPASFVEDYFTHLLDRFDLRAMEAELNEEIAAVGMDDSSVQEDRILTLTREIALLRETYAQRDHALAEEARSIRSVEGGAAPGIEHSTVVSG